MIPYGIKIFERSKSVLGLGNELRLRHGVRFDKFFSLFPIFGSELGGSIPVLVSSSSLRTIYYLVLWGNIGG